MVTEENAEKESSSAPITKAQEKLIDSLIEETNKEMVFDTFIEHRMSKKEAMSYIDLLKDLKNRQYQERRGGQTSPKFDKICYAMIYKLVWNSVQGKPIERPWKYDSFADWVFAEYSKFKECQQCAEKQVAKEAV